MGGSIVCNPNTPRGQWMQQDLQQWHSDSDLFEADACALWHNSTDFAQRNDQINATAEALADWLYDHPQVQRVYYPKYTAIDDHGTNLYQQLLQSDSSTKQSRYGGLMSIVLEPNMCQRSFYDALDVAKGPSLGTDFTLVCPYTLLAHYHELDFAMSYNVPPNLLRIAVGLEPLETLRNKFDQAFQSSQLYPKLGRTHKDVTGQKRAYTTWKANRPSWSRHSIGKNNHVFDTSVRRYGHGLLSTLRRFGR